jgi:MFS family permease
MRAPTLVRLLPLFAALFIDTFSFGLMYPVIVALFHDPMITQVYNGAVRNNYLSLAFSLFPLGMFFGASLLGDLSDALGRKRTLLICMAGLAAAYGLMWLGVAARTLEWFLIGRLLSGVMAGTGPIAQAAMMDASAGGADDGARSEGMATVVLVNCLALVSGPAIGGVLGHADFRLPLAFALALCIADLVWIAAALPGAPLRPRHVRFSPGQPFQVFVRAIRHPVLRGLAVSFLVYQFGFGLYFTYAVVRMQVEFHLATFALGLFSATLGAGFVLGTTLGHKLARAWLGDDATVTVGALFACGTLILLSALPWGGAAAQWALVLPIGLIDIVAYVGSLSLISAAASSEEQGWALGIGASMMALAFFAAGLMAAALSIVPVSGLLALGGAAVLASILPMQKAWAAHRVQAGVGL